MPRRATKEENESSEELPAESWGHVLERVEQASRVSFQIICPFLVREFSSDSIVGGQSDSVPLTRDYLVGQLSKISGRRESDARETAQLALQVIKGSVLEGHQINLADDGKINFDRLHRLYPPGSTVYGRDDGGWRAYKVDRVERPGGVEAELHVHAFFLDFDKSGNRLVPHSALLVVPPYPSARKVRSLALVPGWYMEGASPGVVEDLVNRGEKFWRCGDDPKCFQYNGTVWPATLGAVSGFTSYNVS